MTNLVSYIRKHLSLRLGLLILVVVGIVFSASFGLLFYHSRQYVKKAAYRHASEVLSQTVHNITAIMVRTEAVTAKMEVQIKKHMEPDSLLAYTRQMLEQNPDIIGFTIALEPNYFPQCGERFSAYSLRQDDSIQTVVETHDYFSQLWYKEPWNQKRALWLEPYIDDTPDILTSNEYNFSFVKPLYNNDGEPVGVLCTDLLLKWLSNAVTEVKPYPNSSAIMLGHDGRYIVHPDTAKLVRESIFSDPDPEAVQDVIPLGQAMISGGSGMYQMIVDGNPAHVFYRPLERTGWSIAIVCPDSDVFSGYNRMLNIALIVIAISLLLLLLFCYQTIRRAVVPVNQLAMTAHSIADGHFDEELPLSQRLDTVGQLQNSFVSMQQSLNTYVNELRQINAETEQRNQELQSAYQLVREADQRKTNFIQDMSHQIRTPLNIINGFTQVIATSYSDLPADELEDITARMRSSAQDITTLTRQLSELNRS